MFGMFNYRANISFCFYRQKINFKDLMTLTHLTVDKQEIILDMLSICITQSLIHFMEDRPL